VRIDVVADGDSNVIGTMVVGDSTDGGPVCAIFPAEETHFLHHLEVPDEFGSLSADELHTRLQAHLATLPG
jgi:hypothetical protein